MHDWLSRARKVFPLRDALSLASPTGLVSKLAAYSLGLNRGDAFDATDPNARDPELLGVVFDALRPIMRAWFRWDVRGLENVPKSGPVLLVANHNGGLLNTEAYLTMLAIWDRFGPDRAVHGLAHDVVFDDPTLRRYAARFGTLRASHESAHNAFAAGHAVLVYPGSDLDSFRAWRDRKTVQLGERAGFVRLALREQVPIVPVISAGPQEQWIVLTRGDAIGRRLGMRRWARTEVFPIVLSLPWGLTSGFMPYLPLPVQTSLAFGAPIRWALGPEAAEDPTTVAACKREVETKMQALLTELYEGRAPFVGSA